MSIYGNVQAFNAGAWAEFYTLDLTPYGGEILRFYAGVDENNQPVTWQGQKYTPWPVEVTGFSISSTGAVARPRMKVGNVGGSITAVLIQTGGIEGARFTRKRTQVKYLDAVNFVNGNSTADPQASLPDDVFYVSQKVNENPNIVEFELAPVTDLQGVMLPARQIIANYCTHIYRGEECGYAGGACAKADDTPTTDLALDRCGKKLSSCKKRFGENGDLPFGGFIGAGLVRFG